jgi:centromere-localized protein 2
MADLPTEAQLLSAFLFPPAPLPLALPLSDFTKLFPPEVRSSPDIPKLYRELQHQVSLGIDDVKQNIAAEVARGDQIKVQIAKSRRKAGQTLAKEGELAMDIEVSLIYSCNDQAVTHVTTDAWTKGRRESYSSPQ